MGKDLADKGKQVTAFNIAGTVFFEGFGGLVCVLVINIDCFPTNYLLPWKISNEEEYIHFMEEN